ncbi:MAG: 16S rRNA (guanine(966)-N(2))-methyltransferase RsmD [Myxococcota bacterium]|nr:16S rRNA (guanine(966)-N(2))-methyltransferase RsmD [Myxococcota bacterium]
MRIISGSHRGHCIKVPRGDKVRPTTDRVREAIFSILSPYLDQARVLDAFAGSGALGLEAISRGAQKATFVEIDRKVLKILRENVKTFAPKKVRLVNSKATQSFKLLSDEEEKFDIIFLDPPYGLKLLPAHLELIGQKNILADDGIVVCEHPKQQNLSDHYGPLNQIDNRQYGDINIVFFTHSH